MFSAVSYHFPPLLPPPRHQIVVLPVNALLLLLLLLHLASLAARVPAGFGHALCDDTQQNRLGRDDGHRRRIVLWTHARAWRKA